uniref:RIIa domain-containing protein n=1 Tax=Catharus ustulatus TaxID=91951 RepID=A0A8C3US14_CATUS
MSIAYSNTSLRVPAGFRNLLEGLAREVLQEQPTDVVAFAAQHFQKLLEQREGEWPCPAPTPTVPSPAPRCIACSVCDHHGIRLVPSMCPPRSSLSCVPITRASGLSPMSPAPCAHQDQASPGPPFLFLPVKFLFSHTDWFQNPPPPQKKWGLRRSQQLYFRRGLNPPIHAHPVFTPSFLFSITICSARPRHGA